MTHHSKPARRPTGFGVVPYIAAWSGERGAVAGEVIARRLVPGIAYRDEVPDDRDERGVLLRRERSAPGQGKPLFGIIHGARQRHAMRELLCQVCADPADCNEQGVLWLMPDHRGHWLGWPEGMGESSPPVCLPCAELSRRLCPALRKSMVAVRVKDPQLAGVRGMIYAPTLVGRQVRDIAADNVTFHDRWLPWTLAHQLVRRLRGCTLVDLDQELAVSDRTTP